MRTVFADTTYWIARALPEDGAHMRARTQAVLNSLQPVTIVTTEEVLTEFLAYFASSNPMARLFAVRMVRQILAHPDMRVVPQTHQSFVRALDLYEARLDKQYSLVDCISMHVVRPLGIPDVLTEDEHFIQEGFVALLRQTD